MKQYHAATVRLAVDATNAEAARAVEQDRLQADAAQKATDAHQQHIEQAAKDIAF